MIDCPICRKLHTNSPGHAYIHCPAYRALVHMSHCVQDGCKYHRYEFSGDWCRYRRKDEKRD